MMGIITIRFAFSSRQIPNHLNLHPIRILRMISQRHLIDFNDIACRMTFSIKSSSHAPALHWNTKVIRMLMNRLNALALRASVGVDFSLGSVYFVYKALFLNCLYDLSSATVVTPQSPYQLVHRQRLGLTVH